MKQKSIWITWHHSSRSRNMAKALDVELLEVFLNENLFQRHIGSSFWTLKILLSRKPDVIYLQYSFLLLLILSIYKIFRFGKTKIIADCHTKALRRKAPGVLNLVFWPIKRFTFKLTDITIVHNDGMKKDIEKLHSKYFVIPDKIPNNNFSMKENNSKRYCVNISSFAVDEPVSEVIEAARYLEKDGIEIYWTGKAPLELLRNIDLPKNLFFTGYIGFDEFYNLLGNASCSMALTTEEDCLQSGAYESLDFEIPMVLSDTKTLRNYFEDSAIYSQINGLDLANAIRTAIKNSSILKERMRILKSKRNREHSELLNKLIKEIP